MFRKGGMFEEIVEQGGSVAKQVGQTVKKSPSDMAKAAVSQVAGGQTPADTPLDAIKQDSGDAQDFVKDLYGAKKPGSTAAHPNPKTPEEAAKLESLRRELHSDYYQKLTHPDKQQELRPAEKVEEEKKKEMIELSEKEAKKPAPLAVSRAQNKAEQFRGVSG